MALKRQNLRAVLFTTDDSLRSWVSVHPDGYILNLRSNNSPNYLMLHEADCSTIALDREGLAPGAFVQREYQKVGGETPNDLIDWIKQNINGADEFKSLCKRCKPQYVLTRMVDSPDDLVKLMEDRVDQIGDTERYAEIKMRIGQRIFRNALLRVWERCPLTGLSDPQLLKASHIKPWAECETDRERLDVNNGILLSSLWDSAFDAGLITFEGSGAVVISTKLSKGARAALNVDSVSEPWFDKEHEPYLAWHRANLFKP